MQHIIDNIEYLFAIISFLLFGSLLDFPDEDDEDE
jgi:hypothetical protein